MKGHLTRAMDILTQLKKYIEEQTTAAKTTADKGNFAEAVQLLTLAITHTTEQNQLADIARAGSKRKEGDHKFTTVKTLENEVAVLSANMVERQAQYTQLIASTAPAIVITTIEDTLLVSTIEEPKATSETELKAETELRAKAEIELSAETELHIEEKPSTTSTNTKQPTTFTTTLPDITSEELLATDTTENSSIKLHRIKVTETEEELAFTAALASLRALQTTPTTESINKSIFNLILEVEQLKADQVEPITELTEALKKTYLRLTGELDHKSYDTLAKTMQGHPSTRMKILGGCMVALAIAIASIAVVFSPVLLGLATAISLTGKTAVIATTASVALTSGTIAALGFGLFANGAKQEGLSKTMSDVDKALLEKPQVTVSMARQ